MNLKDTYNKIAEDWAKDHSGDDWWKEGANHFLSLLDPGSSVLDIGCGPGTKTSYIAKKGFKATGIDFSEKMIEIAKDKFKEADFEVIDVYEIDKYSRTFDGIYMQAVLLHIPKSRVLEVLEKIKGRLNPNGFMCMVVKLRTENQPEELVVKENDYGYEYERLFSFFTEKELEDYIGKVGMVIESSSIVSSGKTQWLQLIIRFPNA